MAPKDSTFLGWPVLRQLASGDFLGRGNAVTSRSTREMEPRT
ncbi:MAG TPA: dehydrogenase, partial [Janibacter terrae]|nr:dehydrogenase [Janibacter terrae]